MIPHMKPNDMKMFYRYLDNATVYFEFGSGGSTYQASIRDNIKRIYSVESDISWQERLKNTIKSDKVTYIYNEMDTRPNTWGHPGPNSTEEQRRNYSGHLVDGVDLIFIDGRFRVACCLKAYEAGCLVIFDDFLNISDYHIVLEYFDIVEKTSDETMVVLKPKDGKVIPKDLIDKYELVVR
jgi:protein O-GlcNAc transferase